MKRNGLWFWLFLIALLAIIYVGAQYVRGETVCSSGYGKSWEWLPPHWECRT